MTHLPLKLRVADRPRPLAAAAWFISGADPARWLEEVARWELATAQTTWLVVPHSLRDRRPCGVVVVVPAGQSPAVAPRAVPYARVADHLLLPAEAMIDPPVSDAEMRELLVWEMQVFHPAAGLVGYRAEDVLRAADLLQAPPAREGRWDRAVPGVRAAGRITGVEPEQPLDAGGVLAAIERDRDGIGDEPASDLPPAPTESAARDLAARAKVPLYKALAWLTGRPPGAGKAAGGKGWRQQLGEWAAAKAAALSKQLEAARNRELNRLLRMLASDPDQGLRFALPLADFGNRGVAPPGAALPPRDANYDPNALRGGKPADAWFTPWEMRQQLEKRYRELATRELNLGRHRRAAYILAQLLGDLSGAASALQQGRFYREAAALYRDKLNNPAAAAACLEAGGLTLEAAEVYAALGKHEKAGDLWQILEQPDEAALCYRRAVAQCLSAYDRLGAARLLESKLASPDEALAVLDAERPASPPCLAESFRLLGRLARHDEAAARLGRLAASAIDYNPSVLEGTVGVLAGVATTYPHLPVRAAAADATRVLAGTRLPRAAPAEAIALVNAVMRLAAEDRLLARDGHRFLAQREAKRVVRPPRPPAPRRSAGAQTIEPAVVASFALPPPRTTWKSAIATRGGFYALAAADTKAVLVRGRWDGSANQWVDWPQPLAAEDDWELIDDGSGSLIVLPLGRPCQGPNRVLAAGRAFGDTVHLHVPPYLASTPVLGLFHDERGVLWAVQEDGEQRLSLNAYEKGRLTHTRSASFLSVPTPTTRRVHLAARTGRLIAAFGQRLVEWTEQGVAWEAELDSPATALRVTPPHVRPRVLVLQGEGARVQWLDNREGQNVGEGLSDPRGDFLPGGDVVLVAGGGGRVYHTEGGRAVAWGRFAWEGEAPMAVTATGRAGQSAVFTATGQVRVFELPKA